MNEAVSETVSDVFTNTLKWAANMGIKLVISALILFVSFKAINFLGRKIQRWGIKKDFDKTLLKTLVYAGKIALKCIVVLCLVGYLGIDTSGAAALVTSLGVCVGLAVNGALANLAGGVLLIITRPFKVDDYIEAQSVSGTVADIRITNTKIVTPDNKVIYVPNGSLANGNIINYSENPTRRVDIDFYVSCTADTEGAKKTVMSILNEHDAVLLEPPPFVRIGSRGREGIEIKSRAWTRSDDYWTVYFDVVEQVKAEFDKNGIEIPFEQLNVNIKNQEKAG